MNIDKTTYEELKCKRLKFDGDILPERFLYLYNEIVKYWEMIKIRNESQVDTVSIISGYQIKMSRYLSELRDDYDVGCKKCYYCVNRLALDSEFVSVSVLQKKEDDKKLKVFICMRDVDGFDRKCDYNTDDGRIICLRNVGEADKVELGIGACLKLELEDDYSKDGLNGFQLF